MTRYRLEVEYMVGRYAGGWHWTLSEVGTDGYPLQAGSARVLHMFRWTAILRGRLAAHRRKTPYTKEFTI